MAAPASPPALPVISAEHTAAALEAARVQASVRDMGTSSNGVACKDRYASMLQSLGVEPWLAKADAALHSHKAILYNRDGAMIQRQFFLSHWAHEFQRHPSFAAGVDYIRHHEPNFDDILLNVMVKSAGSHGDAYTAVLQHPRRNVEVPSTILPVVPANYTARARASALAAMKGNNLTFNWLSHYSRVLRNLGVEDWLAEAEAALRFDVNISDGYHISTHREGFLAQWARLYVHMHHSIRLDYMRHHEPDFDSIILRAMVKETGTLGRAYQLMQGIPSSAAKRKAPEEAGPAAAAPAPKKPHVEEVAATAPVETVNFNFVDSATSAHISDPTTGYWHFTNSDSGGLTYLGFIHGSGKGIRAYLTRKFPAVTSWNVTTYNCPHVE